MDINEFDFDLPTELIAQHPLPQRDASRMLVVGGGSLSDNFIHNLPDFIRPGDVVVMNNSRVIPARFDATTHDGVVYEITLHTIDNAANDAHAMPAWWAFAKKFGHLNIGDVLTLADGKTTITIRDKNDVSGILCEFNTDDVFGVLDVVGKMPLPPYMKREEEAEDRERYQNVYAKVEGSMAAPTAGLHFTPELLSAVRAAGAQIVEITLHVGAGTWIPVKVTDTDNHHMHSEWCVITPEQAEIINKAKRVIAIGTTSMRTLESAVSTDKNLRVSQFCGMTDIFITPGYKFHAVDILLTNFHLPKSTLFMLVSAFSGLPEMKAAYAHAIAEKYRFFSYGDCCLLFRKD